MADSNLQTTGSAQRTWVIAFILIALALLAGGYGYYHIEAERIRQEKYQEIAAIGKLKADQIRRWRHGRLADARRGAGSPFFQRALAAWRRVPDNPELLADWRKRLQLEQEAYDYADVMLLDLDGNILLAANDEPNPADPATKEALAAAIAGQHAVLSDFYRAPDGGVYLDTVVPVLDPEGRPLAMLVLRSQAESYLYPLIQSWPTPSRSAETLLVRQEDETVVFLNDLRHQADTALTLRIPLAQSGLPAAQAALGRQGVFQGQDYRGVEVLADLRPVPESPWFMVAKVDTDEILAEARYRSWMITLFVLLGILLAAAVTAMAYRRRQADLYRDRYEAERRQREAQETFRTTLYSIGDAVITTDQAGRIRQLNPVAEQLTGWPEAEALGKPLDEVFRIINEETRAVAENPGQRVLREGVVVGLANHTLLIARDGTERAIADSGASIRAETGAITGVVLVFRDQTQERAAEKALHDSEQRFRRAVEEAPLPIMIYAEDGQVLALSRAWREITGYGETDIPTVANWVQRAYGKREFKLRSFVDRIYQLDRRQTEGEFTITCQNGARRVWQFNSTPLGPLPDGRRLVISMAADITERQRAEAELRRSEARMRTLSNILQHQADSVQEFLDFALAEAIRLLDSKIGYIYHYHEDRREFVLNTWSKDVMQECAVVNPQTCYELDKTGIWGEAVRQRRPILVNDFLAEHPLKRGYPEGHVKLLKYLTVPVFSGDKIVGVVGVANKETDYDDTDVLQLTLLMNTVWKVVEQRQAEMDLKRIEWMLSKTPVSVIEDQAKIYEPAYGNLTALNRDGLILKSVGRDLLGSIAADYLALLGTSSAIYEANGECAFGIFASGWCQLLDQAARKLCHTADNTAALASGRWLCHESCWTDCSQGAIARRAPVDIECHGGIRLYAAPIVAGGEVIGVINFGYGDPPKDPTRLQALAQTYQLEYRDLLRAANAYDSRPAYIVEMAKRRLHASAQLIGALVESKRAAAQERQAVRSFRMLSRGNEAIALAVEETGLMREICRILVEEGGWRLAWVGLAEAGPGKRVRPVAQTGFEQGYLGAIDITWDDSPTGRGPTGTAIRTAKPVVCQNTMTDPNFAPWREAAAQRGYASSIALPLTGDSGVFGALNIYSAEPDAFSLTEVELLRRLVDNLAYALQSLRMKAAHEKAERNRAALEAQLLQAQKMEAVGRLAGGVAHDFNNMLAVITGHADLALDQTAPDSPLHAHLLEIQKAAERSADLTRQLLAFARKQTIAPKALDLNDTIAGMLKMLGRLIGEDIDLFWKPALGLWLIHMDPAQLDQILANLAVNARDAIASVGKVTIETGNVEFNETYCETHAGFVPGQYVLLAVSDNGCGMDKETMAQLFDPFFTTKPSGQGTGLGLAMVYGIVKQNRGFINVYSEPGKGTTFKVYLPRHGSHKADAGVTREQAVAPTGTETVLLVEDEEALLQLVATQLEGLGYRVLAAGSPGQALQMAEEYAGDIPLLMTDVIMPEMSGRDLCQRLSDLRPNLQCLYMSGYTANVIAHHGVLDEGVHFLQKPFSREALATKLREAISRP